MCNRESSSQGQGAKFVDSRRGSDDSVGFGSKRSGCTETRGTPAYCCLFRKCCIDSVPQAGALGAVD